MLTCRLPAGLTNPTVDTTLRYESGSGVHLQTYNTTSWGLDSLIDLYKAKTIKGLTLDTIIPTTEYSFNYEDDDR